MRESDKIGSQVCTFAQHSLQPFCMFRCSCWPQRMKIVLVVSIRRSRISLLNDQIEMMMPKVHIVESLNNFMHQHCRLLHNRSQFWFVESSKVTPRHTWHIQID